MAVLQAVCGWAVAYGLTVQVACTCVGNGEGAIAAMWVWSAPLLLWKALDRETWDPATLARRLA